MHPVNLIAKALQKQNKILPELHCKPTMAICAVTGQECLCLPRKEVIGKAFNNLDLLAYPESKFVGVDTFYAWYYGYKKSDEQQRNSCPERMSSWFCDGEEFLELTRQEVREWVLKEKMPDIWTGYATTSYKKHGSLNARVNIGNKRIWLFETRRVDCSDMGKVMEWWGVMNIALKAGIGRSVIESLDCPPFLIKKVGLNIWLEFEQWARPKYLSALYSFLAYLLPSQEELGNASNKNNP